MKALIVYHLIAYMKSYNYVPPMSIFIMILVVNYSIYPNPVLASYGMTAIYLYIIAAWISLRFFHTEDMIQQQVTILHAGNDRKYFCSMYLAAGCIVVLLAFISIVYPIVFRMFSKQVTLQELGIGFATHCLLGMVAIALSGVFSRAIIANKINSWLGISLMLLVSIASLGLEQLIPGYWKYILFVLPPVSELALLMRDPLDLHGIFRVYLWTMAYTGVVVAVFFIIYRRKKKFL
ncbi:MULTISPECIES: hypothetical protein [Clostridia]|uniref:hypothetical protein n=1 Tax=Clostridia TaxID=186801 RepID=UPI000EA1D8D4|nr:MULTISPECIES: hypothetical protein [Clostridia]NBJ71181.1 hypothetical protein [Roseburia sp. 1XD42-34]RKI75106.1 hypothetical protein D7V87_17235 [Clostridium sp. 1xD42-85]